jgi:hypothetical protein
MSLASVSCCSLASANAGGGTSEGSANAVSGMDAAAAASGMGAHARLSKIRT